MKIINDAVMQHVGDRYLPEPVRFEATEHWEPADYLSGNYGAVYRVQFQGSMECVVADDAAGAALACKQEAIRALHWFMMQDVIERMQFLHAALLNADLKTAKKEYTTILDMLTGRDL